MDRIIIKLPFALLLLLALPAQAQVFKCTSTDGKVLYSDEPCTKDSHSKTIPGWWLKANTLPATTPVQTTPKTDTANNKTPPKEEKQDSRLQTFLDIVRQFSHYADKVLGKSSEP